MQCGTYCSVACIEFLDHALDLFTKPCIVEIDAKDICTALEVL